MQTVTGDTVEVAFADQDYTRDQPAQNAMAHGGQLEVVKPPEAKHGFELRLHRWVVACSIAWAARFRRLARDDERLPETLQEQHFLVLAILMLTGFAALMGQCG